MMRLTCLAESDIRTVTVEGRVRLGEALRLRCLAVGACLVAMIATGVSAQTTYTFTSGPGGDGFDWPPSPTGLMDGDYFESPDSIEIHNYTGSNVFFDSQYLTAGNAPGITDEALWGDPLSKGFSYLDMYFYQYPQNVAFDFAWSVGGQPGLTPDFIYVYLEDSDGRSTEIEVALGQSFPGLGGFTGYADFLIFDVEDLFDDFFNIDGEQFIDISYVSIFTDADVQGGATTEFAIDNLQVDGGFGGGGEVFPSVNGGTIDVTNSTLGYSILRGVGTYAKGVEVTNGSGTDTTFSTELEGGSQLADEGQVANVPISAGETLFTADLVSIDRSLPSAPYFGTINIVNDNDPFDPDSPVTIAMRLIEAPVVTAISPVDVTGGDQVRLTNTADPPGGFRASAKVTGSTVTGPFDVSGYEVDAAVKPGEVLTGDASFHRFGLLTGDYDGTLTASLQMTFFVGANNEFETFLAEAEPMPDEQWSLEAELIDHLNDSFDYGIGDDLGPERLGVNNGSTAATLVGGTASQVGTASMELNTPLIGATTGIVGDSVTSGFSTGVPIHAVQLTYRDSDVCPTLLESDLRLLSYDGGSSDWRLAVDGNSRAGGTFFDGSFQEFLIALGGAPLASALGTHGRDTTNNHTWAILDHAAEFGTGAIGLACGKLGDLDDDGDVDLDDHLILTDCASNPGVPVLPGCQKADFDRDGDVDLASFATLSRVFEGP